MVRKTLVGRLVSLFVLFCLLSSANAADLGNERGRMKHILDTVARDVEKNYYDPNLHGLEWKALVAEARAKIDKAQSAGEMITAIVAVLNKLNDSHTVFLPPGRVNKTLFGFDAKAFGENVYVYEVEKGGAAEGAGLKRGDQILSVNGFNALRENIETIMLYLRVLRPAPALKLEVARGAQAQTITVNARIKQGTTMVDLTDSFNIWSLVREAEVGEMYHYGNYDGGIGFLQLPSFNADTESSTFLQGLVKKVAANKAFVIDLRGNPGGTVPTLAQFSGFFDDQPTVIAQIKGRKSEDMKIKPQKTTLSGPLFVLVDSQTASAAEIFARHFQRIGRAKVIGDHTSGRVTAARFFPEQEGIDSVVPYGVEVTIGHVIFPGDEDLEKKGVTPDHVCIPTGEHLARDADPCLGMAVMMARKSLGLAESPQKPADKKD
jgi:carboxyl-terminal processing protease